mmetsp:Transcript_2776/g.8423  ORF Transcript_2776/g.8423 Transcript_2776/m.8423 type:complete len:206 (+) Transcript_2776:267-884(+)|eukprot:CAMPEP_0198724496 /NCGR_PEP_ID=MMETSP1475-20131203/1950_1 /TAXON_ID= ORGANISM="Unidentified sp., Strain CCMP1999" /NCGR_SAMPLE_ID=MMETSP1475 /ASSEMBLY_ACC=CAM_ASM_001111 /LENGTH=205 /DNA_ID=CAMNT_0044486035 /DNA_START=219 /DNA_END=836 /DNA_ORIENTATION=+
MLDVGRQQGLAEVRGRKLLQLLRPFTTYRRENSKFRGELTLTTGETPRKIIFLDIDGVLHSFDCSSTLFCSLQMLVLKEIVDKTGAGIVLTSNWRRTRAGMKEVSYHLKDFGMKVYSKTIDLRRNTAKARAQEIYMWLKQHPEVDSWLVLDDLNLLKYSNEQHLQILSNNFVRTNPLVGLTRDDLRPCLQILGASEASTSVVVAQ